MNFVKDAPLQCAIENGAPRHNAKTNGQDRMGEERTNEQQSV